MKLDKDLVPHQVKTSGTQRRWSWVDGKVRRTCQDFLSGILATTFSKDRHRSCQYLAIGHLSFVGDRQEDAEIR